MKQVSKRQAQAVLAAIKEQFASYGPEFTGLSLEMAWEWAGEPRVAVVWEEGPYEWAYRVGVGGVAEEETAAMQEFAPGTVVRTPPVTMPAGVWVEPYSGWAVSVYPTEGGQ